MLKSVPTTYNDYVRNSLSSLCFSSPHDCGFVSSCEFLLQYINLSQCFSDFLQPKSVHSLSIPSEMSHLCKGLFYLLPGIKSSSSHKAGIVSSENVLSLLTYLMYCLSFWGKKKTNLRSQISPCERHSGWRTRGFSLFTSSPCRSVAPLARAMDSKFSTVKNLHLNQTHQKTSSFCECL